MSISAMTLMFFWGPARTWKGRIKSRVDYVTGIVYACLLTSSSNAELDIFGDREKFELLALAGMIFPSLLVSCEMKHTSSNWMGQSSVTLWFRCATLVEGLHFETRTWSINTSILNGDYMEGPAWGRKMFFFGISHCVSRIGHWALFGRTGGP